MLPAGQYRFSSPGKRKISYLFKINENIQQGEYTLPSTRASFTFGGDIYTRISNNPKIYIQYVPIKSTDNLDLVLFSSKPNVSRGEETSISLSATIKRLYPYFRLVLTTPSGIRISGSEGAQSTAGGFILEKQFNLLKQLKPEEKINVITLRASSNEIGYYLIKGNAVLYYPNGIKSEVNVCMPLLVNP